MKTVFGRTCETCEWAVPGRLLSWRLRCTHPTVTIQYDPVWGKPVLCRWERQTRQGACGTFGHLYKGPALIEPETPKISGSSASYLMSYAYPPMMTSSVLLRDNAPVVGIPPSNLVEQPRGVKFDTIFTNQPRLEDEESPNPWSVENGGSFNGGGASGSWEMAPPADESTPEESECADCEDDSDECSCEQ